ncbi:cytochrome c3 family protein [Thalassotalea sp. G2M2-11]|uniref:cytochrome c3 family protein n=1 Tax=Thalassotalea sp. G2M2-11 TaxID=2787627 RepID=UPI0019D13158|nr:cytochrome c3 family protein [Thalassotalea sp. G2M2-11]
MKMMVLLLGLIAIIAFGISLVIGRQSPHLLVSNCQSCHLASNEITPKNAYMLLNSQEVLCASCHPNAIKASHPSGFSPNRELPDIYQLNWENKLTCSTCHDIHSDKQGLMVTNRKGKAFCHDCHQASFFDNMKDLGTSLFISGHTVAQNEPFGEKIDSFSAKCIECHSNESGNLAITLTNNNSISHSNGRVSHPIGRDYNEAAKYGGYRPIKSIDKRINLPEGKVSCISCHKAYAKVHGEGVFAGASQYKLCNSCHDI